MPNSETESSGAVWIFNICFRSPLEKLQNLLHWSKTPQWPETRLDLRCSFRGLLLLPRGSSAPHRPPHSSQSDLHKKVKISLALPITHRRSPTFKYFPNLPPLICNRRPSLLHAAGIPNKRYCTQRSACVAPPYFSLTACPAVMHTIT